MESTAPMPSHSPVRTFLQSFAPVENVLQRDDLTVSQRREIAKEFDQVARGLDVSVQLDVQVKTSGES